MKRITQSYARKHAGEFTDAQADLLATVNEWADQGRALAAANGNKRVFEIPREPAEKWFNHGERLRYRLEHAELGALDFAKLDEFITEQLEDQGFRFAE